MPVAASYMPPSTIGSSAYNHPPYPAPLPLCCAKRWSAVAKTKGQKKAKKSSRQFWKRARLARASGSSFSARLELSGLITQHSTMLSCAVDLCADPQLLYGNQAPPKNPLQAKLESTDGYAFFVFDAPRFAYRLTDSQTGHLCGSELALKGTSLATLLPSTREWYSWLRLAPERGAGQQLSV